MKHIKLSIIAMLSVAPLLGMASLSTQPVEAIATETQSANADQSSKASTLTQTTTEIHDPLHASRLINEANEIKMEAGTNDIAEAAHQIAARKAAEAAAKAAAEKAAAEKAAQEAAAAAAAKAAAEKAAQEAAAAATAKAAQQAAATASAAAATTTTTNKGTFKLSFYDPAVLGSNMGYGGVAANLSIFPKGTQLKITLSDDTVWYRVVNDTGSFAAANPYQLDVAMPSSQIPSAGILTATVEVVG